MVKGQVINLAVESVLSLIISFLLVLTCLDTPLKQQVVPSTISIQQGQLLPKIPCDPRFLDFIVPYLVFLWEVPTLTPLCLNRIHLLLRKSPKYAARPSVFWSSSGVSHFNCSRRLVFSSFLEGWFHGGLCWYLGGRATPGIEVTFTKQHASLGDGSSLRAGKTAGSWLEVIKCSHLHIPALEETGILQSGKRLIPIYYASGY